MPVINERVGKDNNVTQLFLTFLLLHCNSPSEFFKIKPNTEGKHLHLVVKPIFLCLRLFMQSEYFPESKA